MPNEAIWRAMTLGFCILLAGCSDDVETVFIDNSGLDCGLTRADLTGSWIVDYASGSRSLTNCDDPAFDGGTVDVTSNPLTFNDVIVFPSDASAGFQVIADGSDPDPDTLAELIVSIEADSCLALFRVWESDDTAYVGCIGTFDLDTRTISGSCESAEADANVDGIIDADCDLSASLTVDVDIVP